MAIKAHFVSPASSVSERTAPATAARSAPRRNLRLEASGIAPDGEETNVTIHNISAAGLLIETKLDLTAGEQFALDLPEAGIVTATIMWRSEHLYGCSFERTLGPAALAAAQLQGLTSEVAATPAPSIPSVRAGEPLGLRLSRLRREAGLTLADVAAVLGVSKPTVWAWEKGKARPLPERLGAIAAALGVTPEVLADVSRAARPSGAVVEDCRSRIAEACNTTPARIRIMIEL